MNQLCSKHCPQECDSISYKLTISTANFPDTIYGEFLKDMDEIKSKFPSDYNITLDDLRKSTLAFNVYYEDLSYTQISQTPKTDIIDLISSVGGLLGLFIGISFLSFAEIIEIILEVIFILFERKKTKVDEFNLKN